MSTVPLTDAQKKGLTVAAPSDPKMRLRLGVRVPLLPNAFVAVAYVPQDTGKKIIETVGVLKALASAYFPQFVGMLVCEDSTQ